MNVSSFLDEVRAAVDEGLRDFLGRKLGCVEAEAPEACVLTEQVADLTLRGGKRLRAALAIAGHRAIRPCEISGGLLDAAMALELFQTYLLIQDDWMDQDDRRRGGPAVHVALGRRMPNAHLAASAAVLASDLSCAYAMELIATSKLTPLQAQAATQTLAKAHREVVLGQLLDMTGEGDLGRVHLLKTAGYTVRAPLLIGARIAGGSPEAIKAVDAFGRAAGIAFQLRDDILGTFGDASETGKGTANDLRAGKRTALIADARKNFDDKNWAILQSALTWDATDDQVEDARSVLVSVGVVGRVEREIEALTRDARQALETSAITDDGRELLLGLSDRLVRRTH